MCLGEVLIWKWKSGKLYKQWLLLDKDPMIRILLDRTLRLLQKAIEDKD